jgi:alpha-L-fucosidase 2
VRYFPFLIAAILCFNTAAHGQQRLRLWYRQPAKEWMETLLLGNGRLGAMADGGVAREDIVLNDITLWSGSPQDADRQDAFTYLPRIRKLLFAGKNLEAEKLVSEKFLCRGAGTGRGRSAKLPYGSYQLLGNLHLQYHYGDGSAGPHPGRYVRELSLDSAIETCSYEVGGVTYHREYLPVSPATSSLSGSRPMRPGRPALPCPWTGRRDTIPWPAAMNSIGPDS